jgi:hypothetical protein
MHAPILPWTAVLPTYPPSLLVTMTRLVFLRTHRWTKGQVCRRRRCKSAGWWCVGVITSLVIVARGSLHSTLLTFRKHACPLPPGKRCAVFKVVHKDSRSDADSHGRKKTCSLSCPFSRSLFCRNRSFFFVRPSIHPPPPKNTWCCASRHFTPQSTGI